MPIERVVVPPFVFLAELSAHEQKLLAGMAEHETVIGAQICKALPFVARHAAEDGALAVHDLVMGERQDEIFGERVVQAEQDLTVMMLAVNRIPADVFERIVHPSHIPLVAESQPAPVDRTIGQAVDSSAAVVALGKRENTSVLKRRSRLMASRFSRPPHLFGIQPPSGRL